MPEFRFRTSEENALELEEKARAAGATIPDYIRMVLFDEDIKFTATEAVRRALMLKKGTKFTIPELYTPQEWSLISRGAAGALGKAFNKYVRVDHPGIIEWLENEQKDRKAQYMVL